MAPEPLTPIKPRNPDGTPPSTNPGGGEQTNPYTIPHEEDDAES